MIASRVRARVLGLALGRLLGDFSPESLAVPLELDSRLHAEPLHLRLTTVDLGLETVDLGTELDRLRR